MDVHGCCKGMLLDLLGKEALGSFLPQGWTLKAEHHHYRLHPQQAPLQLPDFCCFLFHSVLFSLKGHITLFCFSLIPAEGDL